MKKQLFAFIFSALFFSQIAFADPLINTSAKQAIVLDYNTGAVLLEKSADERMPTSSMSKVMSMYMVFDALNNNVFSLEDELLVSEKAWRKGGSKMFVEVGKKVKIEDLLRGVIIQSGNDATIVLAEGISGSEDAFAENITLKAKDLGMNNSNFANASGWPDPNHYSTARDLSILASALITDFPQYYHYFSEEEFTYNNIKQRNRNPLLYRNIGADGIKTGHTEDGGYGLIGSGTYNDRRVILVINGLEDEQARAQESARLLEWGLRRFENRKIFNEGDEIERVEVALGKEKTVAATSDRDLLVTLPKALNNGFKVTAKFKEPLLAPVNKGDQVGTLIIEVPNQNIIEHPLYAAENVKKLGGFSSTIQKIKLFFFGRG